MSKIKINKYAFWIIIFISFLGFYAITLIAVNLGIPSRQITIPIRLLLSLATGLLLVLNFNKRMPWLYLFLSFSTIYGFRIAYDYSINEYYYLKYSELLFYFLSFAVVPFVGVSKMDYRYIDFKKVYTVFLISALSFGILSSLFYSKFIGQVARLSTSSAGEDVISPLILSYCGTLIIGVIFFYLLNNRLSFIIRLLSYITIVLAIIPFLLGASRGSIFALALPFLIMLLTNLSVKHIIRYTFIILVSIILLIYLDDYFQSGLLARFTNIGSDIESGSSSASRLDIWTSSFNQFVDNPIFGDKLNTTNVDHYPHNIFIEVLQSVGLLGFIPFLVLIIKGIKDSYRIFKYNKSYSWLTIFFLQALIQNLFSGAIYSAAWLWTGLAIVLSLNHYLKKS